MSQAVWEPQATPETQPFWDSCARGRLTLQRCAACARHYFPPQPTCPRCLGTDVAWDEVSGRGHLHSWVVVHVPPPDWPDETPYVLALVELAEGPRLYANIVDVVGDPDDLVIDSDVEVCFRARGAATLPMFRSVR